MGELLDLVSEDVVLDSSRDGHFEGRPSFEAYVRRVKPTGRWQQAYWNTAANRAEVIGIVKVLMVQ